jgi:hypothetical protein
LSPSGRTGLANLPTSVRSFNAPLALTEQVLDPVVDWFGKVLPDQGTVARSEVEAVPA